MGALPPTSFTDTLELTLEEQLMDDQRRGAAAPLTLSPELKNKIFDNYLTKIYRNNCNSNLFQ